MSIPAFQIQVGQFTKETGGSVEVAFPQAFLTVPSVFLTPTYSGSPITFVDSVVSVTTASFTVSSPNSSNPTGPYTVAWLAITVGE